MKAVVKVKPERGGAEFAEVDIPTLKPDEVLLRVQATSICGTDVHIYEWNPWAQRRIGEKRLPQILGHEVAGEIVGQKHKEGRLRIIGDPYLRSRRFNLALGSAKRRRTYADPGGGP